LKAAIMKTFSPALQQLSLAAILAAAPGAAAQPEPENKTTVTETEKTVEAAPAGEIATGRVFSVEPTALLVTPANVSIPLTFNYDSTTPLTDEVEKPVLWDQIRSGLPVTVHYETHGDKLTATKVVVTRKMLTGGETTEPDQAARKREMLAEVKRQKAIEATERAKALPAAAGGTIMGFEQVIAVRTPDSADVVQYVVNNSTLYVDTAGKPVPLQFVRTGVPVSIQYVEDAGRRIATQFVLERIPRGAREANPALVTRTAPSTGTSQATPGGTVEGGIVSTVDENGNIVRGVLEDGFVNPPVTVLPSAGQQIPGGTSTTTPSTSPPGGRPGAPQPGATQPGTTQPGTTQPGTPQPGTAQPGAAKPATPPAGNRQPGTGTPGTPSPAAPGNTSPGSGR
jgi:hypothetical protein